MAGIQDGTIIDGRYKVISRIGSGGMAEAAGWSATFILTAMLTTAGTTRRTRGAKVSGPVCTRA